MEIEIGFKALVDTCQTVEDLQRKVREVSVDTIEKGPEMKRLRLMITKPKVIISKEVQTDR